MCAVDRSAIQMQAPFVNIHPSCSTCAQQGPNDMPSMTQSPPSMSHTRIPQALMRPHLGWPSPMPPTAEEHRMAIRHGTLCRVCGQAPCTLPLAARGSPRQPGYAPRVTQLLSWLPGLQTGLVLCSTRFAGALRCKRGCCIPRTCGWQGPWRTEGGRGTSRACSGDNNSLSVATCQRAGCSPGMS